MYEEEFLDKKEIKQPPRQGKKLKKVLSSFVSSCRATTAKKAKIEREQSRVLKTSLSFALRSSLFWMEVGAKFRLFFSLSC